jgi:hypothetical protein
VRHLRLGDLIQLGILAERIGNEIDAQAGDALERFAHTCDPHHLAKFHERLLVVGRLDQADRLAQIVKSWQ